MSPINVKLRNETIFLINIAGTVYLLASLILTHIYYIHIFNVSLISNTTFIDSSLCHLTFPNKQCLILLKRSTKLVSLVNRHGDLYVLKTRVIYSLNSFPFTCKFVSNVSSILWLRRLSHPSHFIHKTLSSIFLVLHIAPIKICHVIYVT